MQNFREHVVALFKAGNCIHDLVICHMAASLIQLVSQICQFLGMGSIVTGHILHQCQQLIHGSVAMMMLMAMLMQVIMGVRMFMRMGMLMMMCMGMGMTIVGMFVGMLVLMGMAMVMVLMEMMIVHSNNSPLIYFFCISKDAGNVDGNWQMAHLRCPENIVKQVIATWLIHFYNGNTGNFIMGKDFFQLGRDIKI